MCRTGGRRCPACNSHAGRNRHNERRRQNRAIRSAVVAWSETECGQADTDFLRRSSPAQVKVFARRHGFSDESFAVLAGPRDPREENAGDVGSGLPPTRADEFTAWSTRDWTDDQLEQALGTVWDDQQSVDALAGLIDARQSAADMGAAVNARAAGLASAASVWTEPVWSDPDPVVAPGRRAGRRLTVDQQVRVDYESWVDTQWLQAEADCNGRLLGAAARVAGVDSRSLFSGSTSRAVAHASEELVGWWQTHGRLTLAAFRHQALGRASDRGAAEQSRLGHFDNAAAW